MSHKKSNWGWVSLLATENPPFIDNFSTKTTFYRGFSLLRLMTPEGISHYIILCLHISTIWHSHEYDYNVIHSFKGIIFHLVIISIMRLQPYYIPIVLYHGSHLDISRGDSWWSQSWNKVISCRFCFKRVTKKWVNNSGDEWWLIPWLMVIDGV